MYKSLLTNNQQINVQTTFRAPPPTHLCKVMAVLVNFILKQLFILETILLLFFEMFVANRKINNYKCSWFNYYVDFILKAKNPSNIAAVFVSFVTTKIATK